VERSSSLTILLVGRAAAFVSAGIAVVAAVVFASTWQGCGDASAPPEKPPEDPPPIPPAQPVKTPRPPAPPPEQPPSNPEPTSPAVEKPPKIAAAGELPAEELGEGDCVLRLQLVDQDTGAPIASAVRVWRLGAAAGRKWSAGDHVQRKVDVPETGVVLRGLPAGKYRVEVDAARRASDDPPEFDLHGELQQVVAVATPRMTPLRCVVVDAAGVPLTTALHRSRGDGWGTIAPRPAPAWASPRNWTGPLSPEVPAGGSHGHSDTDSSLREIEAGVHGFEIGSIAESSRAGTRDSTHELSFDGRNSVRVFATSEDVARGDGYVAVSVPLADLAARVRLPNGTSALDAGAVVTAKCAAALRTHDAPADFWRGVPIAVQVKLAGYATLEFEWRAADGAGAASVLVPSAK